MEIIRRLLKLAKTEKNGLLLAILFLGISSVCSLAFPQIVRWILDHVLIEKDEQNLRLMAFGLVVLFFILAVSSSLRFYFFTVSGEKIVTHLRTQLFSSIMNKEISFFDFNRTGELMSRLSSDCTTLQNTVSVNISMLLRFSAQMIGGLVFMAYTSWQLTVGLILLLIPGALIMAVYAKSVKELSKLFQEQLAKSSIVAEENFSGIKTVKSFTQEASELRRYQKAISESLLISIKKNKMIAWLMAAMMLIGGVAITLVIWYGGHLVMQSEMTIGDIGQFLVYLMLVAMAIAVLGGLWSDLVSSVAASSRVFEIIENEREERSDGLTLPNVMGHIKFENVFFQYPSRKDAQVLNQISIEINPGETVALVGQSGSGKSTLAQLVSGFYSPNKGNIYLDGHDIQKLNLKFLRSQIAIVSQEPLLVSSTIRENILYGRPDASDAEILEAARQANALDFINNFPDKFNTKVGEKGTQLSGGQKQRIAIARAILKNPKILILDEATSHLDSQSEEKVQLALRNLMKGRSCLVVAHRLATIKDADRIIVMVNGRILEVGNHLELIKNERGYYFQLLQKQFSDKVQL